MGKFESELTRRYLLNSNSRGSLEEVVSNEVRQEEEGPLCGDEDCTEDEHLGNHQFMKQWEGRSKTHAFFRQSYE